MERIDPIAPLIAEYYNWLSGNGGREPSVLIAGLAPMQRDAFLKAMDDVNFMWSLTAPLRDERIQHHAPPPQAHKRLTA